jgi:aminoglycoside phosphotransferase (APT) family kinase protein
VLAAARRAPAIVHADIHAANVLWRGGDASPLLLDWDYAHVGDPLEDLASIFARHPASARHRAVWVSAAGLDGQIGRGELEAMTQVYRRLAWYWLLAQSAEAPPALRAAMDREARRLFASLTARRT